MSGGSSFLSDTLGNFFSSSNPAPTKSNFMSAPISGIQTSVGRMPQNTDLSERSAMLAGASGLHPSIESGYGISSAALTDPQNSGGPYSGGLMIRENITPSFKTMKPGVLDVKAYEKAYNRWSLIENERRKRLNSALGMLGGLGKSGGSSASGGGGGGGAAKVGGGRQTQMASMGVSDKPKDPFRQLEDFQPFLKNYRTTS